MATAERDDEKRQRPEPADVEAFMRLFGEHRRRLYQYVLALLPNLQDAEDVLQETNIICWRKFGEFQPSTNFLAWASRIAHFEVLKRRRAWAREGTAVVPLDDAVLEQLAHEAAEDAGELAGVREALQRCLGKLAPADRELIVRRYAAGEQGKHLAEQMGRPANSVYKSIGRIRLALLDCVTRTLRLAEWPGGAA